MRRLMARRSIHARKRRLGAAFWRALAALTLITTSVGTIHWAEAAPVAVAQVAPVTPPAAPELAAPLDGAMVQDAWRDVELHWDAVPGALEYQAVLNDGARTGPWVADTSWSPGSLPAGSYQWTVRARNAAGIGAPGQDFSFTIAPQGIAEAMDPLPFPLQQPVQPAPDPMADIEDFPAEDGESQVTDPAVAGEPTSTAAETPLTAGTPVPVAAVIPDPSITAAGDADGANTGEIADPAGGDVAAGAPTGDGQDVQPEPDTGGSDTDGGTKEKNENKSNKDKNDEQEREDREGKEREAREPKEREDRPRANRDARNGNGGVSEVIAAPVYSTFKQRQLDPLEPRQQDAEDATAGATGESGTVNGVPRETAETAPVVTTGPGVPLAPGEVILPPAVPGLPGVPPAGAQAPAPGVDPTLAGGIGGTTELAFGAVSDTTVFTSAPNAPQSAESAGLLAIGGPQGAVTLISFDVSGVGEGVVLSALLTFTGAGATGGLGGSVGVIYDYVVPDGLTANGVPDGGSALNVHGAPSWFEAVEPGGLTAIDVTGSVNGDGAITFVLPGQAESISSFHALESGILPELILTVALPA